MSNQQVLMHLSAARNERGAAIVILGRSIGMSSAIFSLIDAVILRIV